MDESPGRNDMVNLATDSIRLTRSVSRKSGQSPHNYGLPRREGITRTPPPSPPAKKRQTVKQYRPTQSYPLPALFKKVFGEKDVRKRKRTVTAPSTRPMVPERIRCRGCDAELPRLCFDLTCACVQSHQPTLCRTCTGERFHSALSSRSLKEICCPTCQSELSARNLSRYFSEQELRRYSEIAVEHPKHVRCLRPGCPNGQIHPPGLRRPKVTCEKCGFQHCFGHRVPWHTGMTCAQYFDHLQEIEENGIEVPSDGKGIVAAELVPIGLTNDLCISCTNCGEKSQTRAKGTAVLHCAHCDRRSCAECFADMQQIETQGMHMHTMSCRFWTHAGWDSTGDVARGVAQIARVKKAFHGQLLSQLWDDVEFLTLPSNISPQEMAASYATDICGSESGTQHAAIKSKILLHWQHMYHPFDLDSVGKPIISLGNPIAPPEHANDPIKKPTAESSADQLVHDCGHTASYKPGASKPDNHVDTNSAVAGGISCEFGANPVSTELVPLEQHTFPGPVE